MPEFPMDPVNNPSVTTNKAAAFSPYAYPEKGYYHYPDNSENSTEELFSLFRRYAWIICGIALAISALMFMVFPISVEGNLDSSLGIISEINDRGSAQGNCEMPDSTIATAFKMQTSQVASFYIGAICRWSLLNGVGAEVSYAWFESGTLAREKAVDTNLGFSVEDKTFQGRPALEVKSKPELGCALVTSYATHGSHLGRGIIQFWVQSPEGKFTGDTCAYARTLMQLTFGDMV